MPDSESERETSPSVTRTLPLSARESGEPVDDTLYEGTPEHLLGPLRRWTAGFLAHPLRPELAERVALQLRLVASDHLRGGALDFLRSRSGTLLLDVIDVALQLDDILQVEVEVEVVGMAPNEEAAYLPQDMATELRWPEGSVRAQAVERLDQLLSDGGSAFRVFWAAPQVTLVRRVDPTVEAAAHTAIAIAEPTAGRYLADAWRKTYGLEPDPTTAYRDAVRAVEQVACPLVLPNEGATLGKVIGHLKQGGHKRRFVLVDRDGEDGVVAMVAMLDRLWTGQVSRHGGGKNSRDQSKAEAEAEAAVHLAATLVQLLSTGALNRRDGS